MGVGLVCIDKQCKWACDYRILHLSDTELCPRRRQLPLHVNKAGHTANTNHERLGRGGNARFHTFQLDHYGPADQGTDGEAKLFTETLVCD